MHATADTSDVIYLQRLGAARDARRYAAVSPESMCRTCGLGGSNVIALRSGFSEICAPHNKRMHATRDTLLVMLRGRIGRARDAQRYAAVSRKA